MSIKLISVLHGSSNNGKTSTLRELCKLLLKEKNVAQIALRKSNGKKSKIENKIGLEFEIPEFMDFATIIQIKTSDKIITIGVGTGGDNSDILEMNLALFKERNCDIVFCATKSSKNSIDYLYNTYLPTNQTAVVIPFYKFKDKDEKIFNMQLAQRMLFVTKLQWNNLDKNNSQIEFN